jgi:hypothetical protein
LLERAEAEDFIEDFLSNAVALRGAERNSLLADNLLNEGEELLLAGASFLRLVEFFEVEAVDELGVDGRLEFLLFFFAQGAGARGGVAEAGTVGARVVRIRT